MIRYRHAIRRNALTSKLKISYVVTQTSQSLSSARVLGFNTVALSSSRSALSPWNRIPLRVGHLDHTTSKQINNTSTNTYYRTVRISLPSLDFIHPIRQSRLRHNDEMRTSNIEEFVTICQDRNTLQCLSQTLIYDKNKQLCQVKPTQV